MEPGKGGRTITPAGIQPYVNSARAFSVALARVSSGISSMPGLISAATAHRATHHK